MVHIYRNIYIDALSFWVGVLIGGLAFFLLSRFLPVIGKILNRWFGSLQSKFQLRQGSTEYHYRNDLLRKAQSQHLAHQLFPLDDLMVAPRLLVPPMIYEPGGWSPIEDITTSTIPFLIDWPVMSSVYNAPACSLADALIGGANLVVVGQPGAGKTTVLADFASQVARKTPQVSAFHDHMILFLHILDFFPFETSKEKPYQKIVEGITQKASRQIQKRLPKLIDIKVQEGKVILLLDGLDELPEKYFDQAADWISALINENPNIQFVVTSSSEYTGPLNRLGFIPIPLAGWTKVEKNRLIEKWEKAWLNALHENNQVFDIDTTLINSWLILDQLDETPFELTLKLWAAYAGDVSGSFPGSEISAHLNRLTKKEKRSIHAMEQLALQMVTSEEPLLMQKDVDNWVQKWKQNSVQFTNPKPADTSEYSDFEISTKASKEFQDLIDANVVRQYHENFIVFYHPLFTSFLAATAINTVAKTISVMDFPEWEKPTRWATRSQVFKYINYHPMFDSTIDRYIQLDDEIMHYNLLKTARWIKNLSGKSTCYPKVMRKLAGIMQSDGYPLNLRARVLLAMICTQDPGIQPFIKGMLSSEKASFRQLAALGCGLLQDVSTLDDLARLLTDPVPAVHRAANLALVNFGTKSAIDSVAYLLLNGNEHQRQAAAEAIANHPVESVSILKEGSEMEDLRVRRAVVYGLKRVAKPWAIEILQKMSMEDKEWVVKDAALHAIEALESEERLNIKPLKAASDTPWLLAFAAERGIGISPGRKSNDLILLALKEGTEEQKIAALSYLKAQGEAVGIEQIVHILKTSRGELKEAAFNTIWYLAMTGIEISGNTPVSQ